MQIIVETTGESTLQTDMLELIDGHWRKIGVQLIPRTSQRDLFRSRIMAGQVIMSAWEGLDNGIPNADTPPAALAPVTDDQLQWPLWSAHFVSAGPRRGPGHAEAQELLALYLKWQGSARALTGPRYGGRCWPLGRAGLYHRHREPDPCNRWWRGPT